MNKALVFKISFLIFFTVTSGYLSGFAQDSNQTAKPQPVVRHTKTGEFPPKQAPVSTNPAGTATPAPARHTAPYQGQQLQEPGTVAASPNDKSLNGQYQYLLSRVYRYQQPVVAAFYKNVQDSLNQFRRKTKEAEAKVNELSKSLKDVQSDASAKQATLSESIQHQDTISMFGIDIAKSTYNYIMWGLVIAFAAIAAVVIMRSGINSREARYRTKLYEELDEEYKNYKLKANEKEKKLARDLQTVRNKLEEITGKPEY